MRQAELFTQLAPQSDVMLLLSKFNVLVAFSLTLVLCAGCQPEEQVTSYTTTRTALPRQPMDTAVVLDQLDHILVAILPQNDKAWFFKLVGKAPAIKRQRKAFEDFLSTIKLATTTSETPSWELPDDWQEKEASAMRIATIVVPDEGGELEIAVSSLPLSVDWEDFLVPNVSRWLGQLRRQPLPKATILKLAKQVRVQADDEATVFELSGVMAQQPMGTNPHAGLGIAPPAKGAAASTASRPKALSYDTPDGWLPGKLSSMRKAAFLLPGGAASDEVTVTSFPDTAQMANVAANVQRWAGQVGMEPPAGDALDKLTEPISVDGNEGSYVELLSPADSSRESALFAAMVLRQGQVWFFKMVGNREIVSGQRAAFREFLASVQFP